jgi:hypothetical protein
MGPLIPAMLWIVEAFRDRNNGLREGSKSWATVRDRVSRPWVGTAGSGSPMRTEECRSSLRTSTECSPPKVELLRFPGSEQNGFGTPHSGGRTLP